MADKILEKGFKKAEESLKRGRKPKNKTCNDCHTTFREVRDLTRHLKNRKMQACGSHCPKLFCTFDQLRKHKNSLQQPKDGHVDFESPLANTTGYEHEPKFHQLIEEKKQEIDDDVIQYSDYTVINKKISPDFTYSQLQEVLSDIYSKQKDCYKLNFGMAYALFNLKTKEFKYHYVSGNNLLFENAITITNQKDLDKFIKRVFDLDLKTTAYLSRPDSSWTFAGLTNIQIWVYSIDNTPIGRPPIDLPSYIKDSTSIISLTYDGHKVINDNLCMFRCLALYFSGKRRGLEKSAKSYKRQLEKATGDCFDNGVCRIF